MENTRTISKTYKYKYKFKIIIIIINAKKVVAWKKSFENNGVSLDPWWIYKEMDFNRYPSNIMHMTSPYICIESDYKLNALEVSFKWFRMKMFVNFMKHQMGLASLGFKVWL
jgi:hypothetical protein